MTEAPIFTVARIAAQADGSFAFSRSGSPALTLAVEDRHGDMVDVVAWRDPSPWWLRRAATEPTSSRIATTFRIPSTNAWAVPVVRTAEIGGFPGFWRVWSVEFPEHGDCA